MQNSYDYDVIMTIYVVCIAEKFDTGMIQHFRCVDYWDHAIDMVIF